MKQRIFLVGLTGSGKTTTAPLIAARLGWPWVDLDHLIEERAGETIPQMFARSVGEFRRMEAALLAEVAAREPVVVATGGGAVLDDANRELMHAAGTMVALEVAPETAIQRMKARGPFPPLLAGDDAEGRWRRMREERAPYYAEADFIIDANDPDPQRVADRVLAGMAARGRITAQVAPEIIPVPLSQTPYEISVAWGALGRLDEQIAALGLPQRLTIITDTTVADLFLPGVLAQMQGAGMAAQVITVPAGEASKSVEQLSAIYDGLIAARHERGEGIIALGGGVVGDLAGYAAATYLRGVPLIHVPTTLLAQVDSSIGGKTGINHPMAKNAIGAFYQPRAVIIDPAALLSLDDRLLREGWGEIVKYAAALDAELFEHLEARAGTILSRAPEWLTPIIARCARLKAEIVSRDEREAGPRMLLNYGHTIGHALEALTGYGTLLHGEAVFLGMAAEARIAGRLGMIPAEFVARQDALSRAAGSPQAIPSLTPEAILEATRVDKKTRGGRVRWVLPTGIGAATTRSDVPDELVIDVLRAWQAL